MLQQSTNQAEITTTSLALETRFIFPSRIMVISGLQAFERQLCDSVTIKLTPAISGFEMQYHGRGCNEEFIAAEAFDLFRHMCETVLKSCWWKNMKTKKRKKRGPNSSKLGKGVFFSLFFSSPFYSKNRMAKIKVFKKKGTQHTALRFWGVLKYWPHFRHRLCTATSCSLNLPGNHKCREHCVQ